MKNHINLPAARSVPVEILRALRELDPAYDVHYLGDGRWAVGRVVQSAERRIIAGKMLTNVARNPNMPRAQARMRIAELGLRGFGVVAIYKFLGEPTDELVQDVRTRHYDYQTDREAAFRAFMEKAEERKEIGDKELEEIEYREKHVHPELFRGRKHFPQGASNGE